MKTKRDMLNSESGFTLIEVLIAASIFVVGILGVISMFSTTIGANNHAKRMMEATTYAAEKIEDLKNTPFTNISAAGNASDNPDGNNIFARTYTTTATNIADLKKITVNVQWNSMSGGTKSVELSTTRAKN